jgi:hypothetical protein
LPSSACETSCDESVPSFLGDDDETLHSQELLLQERAQRMLPQGLE